MLERSKESLGDVSDAITRTQMAASIRECPSAMPHQINRLLIRYLSNFNANRSEKNAYGRGGPRVGAALIN
jgi:hypothetical protein